MINLHAWELGLWVGFSTLPLGVLALIFAHSKPKLRVTNSGWALVFVWLIPGVMAASFAHSLAALAIAGVGSFHPHYSSFA